LPVGVDKLFKVPRQQGWAEGALPGVGPAYPLSRAGVFAPMTVTETLDRFVRPWKKGK